jgi:hypothetical protein
MNHLQVSLGTAAGATGHEAPAGVPGEEEQVSRILQAVCPIGGEHGELWTRGIEQNVRKLYVEYYVKV